MDFVFHPVKSDQETPPEPIIQGEFLIYPVKTEPIIQPAKIRIIYKKWYEMLDKDPIF